jgi:hypothetical protein
MLKNKNKKELLLLTFNIYFLVIGLAVFIFATTAFVQMAYAFFNDPINQWQITPIVVSRIEKAGEVSLKDWVLNAVKEEGISPAEAEKIIQCESNWNDQATHINGDGSIDRGLWQINSKYHPNVTPSCTYEYSCATREAIKIYKSRGSWDAWTCKKVL